MILRFLAALFCLLVGASVLSPQLVGDLLGHRALSALRFDPYLQMMGLCALLSAICQFLAIATAGNTGASKKTSPTSGGETA